MNWSLLKLKKILEVTFAQRFRIINEDNNLTVWEGRRYGEGYDTMRSVYDDYEVTHMRVKKGELLEIHIQKESWL